ncbi:hypothetical protein PoB_000318900 [Plakobranchus ocellatus]|uniref:Secreted protein n=1 Tax=Plakobranchus ocellatus TaxID=259542 RepID=A0AAV3Y395_9GAST|nr:hypothetical protein PoB_000318900 [Plakobranchus ocellatus]
MTTGAAVSLWAFISSSRQPITALLNCPCDVKQRLTLALCLLVLRLTSNKVEPTSYNRVMSMRERGRGRQREAVIGTETERQSYKEEEYSRRVQVRKSSTNDNA